MCYLVLGVCLGANREGVCWDDDRQPSGSAPVLSAACDQLPRALAYPVPWPSLAVWEAQEPGWEG